MVDETGLAVAGAHVELRAASGTALAVTSDLTGAFTATLEKPGEYQIVASRETFFLFHGSANFQDGAHQLTITLNHLQEFAESVDVVYSPPAIDLQEPSDKKQLNNVEILSVPYPAPQDLRNSLPLMNGVVQDTGGHLHFNGGNTEQTNFQVDGFNVSDPVTGQFNTRLNIESVRTLDYDGSRFSAEQGRGSAGVVDVKTKMGDDRLRFGGTNFVPGFSSEDGFHMNKWTPRLELSGPIVKGRAWFHNGFDAFYDNDVVHGLPRGEDRTSGLTTSNLSRFQVNITPSNILTGSFLFNYMDQD
ncbi:MAG TPA: carboxypeptidase-like regulatory domain-containing protein, partial [Bryobacteraceae bacterium]|nr:carboxypeptidase-like regulatory domain-containing protein [Bryobacteraceae bacterium]